jgi:nucleoside-diphosphate-sugar epimerase
MKRVILIGGSGFLGSRLMTELLQGEFEIFAVENKTSLPKNRKLHMIEGGISAITTELINEINPEIIFHCARPTFPRFKRLGRYLASLSAFRKNQRLLKTLQKSASKPLLVFASGSLMYGNSELPHDESSTLQPISYARQYYRGEIPFLNILKKKIYPVQIIRLPWLLGNGSWFSWFYLNSLRQHGSIPIFGEGKNMMEILNVEDAAKLMLEISILGKNPGIFNIPSQKALTQKEFTEEIANIFNAKVLDYKKLFPGKHEKETMEAFTSNIQLSTKHTEIVDKFAYTSAKKTLEKIKKEQQTG